MAGYLRRPRDLYRSAPWVIEPLLKHVDIGQYVWEPAAGARDLSNALTAAGKTVWSTDINDGEGKDFLDLSIDDSPSRLDAIVSNFPYSRPLTDRMLGHALSMMAHNDCQRRIVALLYYTTFDNAKERRRLFNHYSFAMKIVLTQRMLIPGFEHRAAPMRNHAWYVWDLNRVPGQTNTTIYE